MYLKQDINNTIIIEKSKFITYLKRVRNEEEYKTFLNETKKKYYDASHVCSGFICHNIKRSSDDGEPSGTAGVPILSTLEKANLDEICALVVRYFGGIKLGAGGLLRAYAGSVSDCIKKAQFIEEIEYPAYELKLSYEMANKIEHFMKSQTILLDIKYDTDITYSFCLENESLLEKIKEYTKGISPLYIEKKVIEKDI